MQKFQSSLSSRTNLPSLLRAPPNSPRTTRSLQSRWEEHDCICVVLGIFVPVPSSGSFASPVEIYPTWPQMSVKAEDPAGLRSIFYSCVFPRILPLNSRGLCLSKLQSLSPLSENMLGSAWDSLQPGNFQAANCATAWPTVFISLFSGIVLALCCLPFLAGNGCFPYLISFSNNSQCEVTEWKQQPSVVCFSQWNKEATLNMLSVPVGLSN